MVLKFFKFAIFAAALFLGCTQIDWTHPKEGNWSSNGKGYCKTYNECYANVTKNFCEEGDGSFSTDMCENPIYLGYCATPALCQPNFRQDNCQRAGGIFSLDACPNQEEVCPETNNNPIIRGSLTDTRDGKTYGTVVIGEQTWMSENLNYNATGSSCYEGNQENCAKYGRLYEAATTIASASCFDYEITGCSDLNISNLSKCAYDSGFYDYDCNCNYDAVNVCLSQKNNERDKGVCPDGWHIPSKEEWETLFNLVCYNEIDRFGVGGYKTANYLKATSGWSDYVYQGINDNGELIFEYRSGNGTDIYSFAALPGGFGDDDYGYRYIGEDGYWLTPSIKSQQESISRYSYHFEPVNIGTQTASISEHSNEKASVRCVMD